jgi:hypothetical protein
MINLQVRQATCGLLEPVKIERGSDSDGMASKKLYLAAVRVGRTHIASTVNTLVLASWERRRR